MPFPMATSSPPPAHLSRPSPAPTRPKPSRGLILARAIVIARLLSSRPTTRCLNSGVLSGALRSALKVTAPKRVCGGEGGVFFRPLCRRLCAAPCALPHEVYRRPALVRTLEPYAPPELRPPRPQGRNAIAVINIEIVATQGLQILWRISLCPSPTYSLRDRTISQVRCCVALGILRSDSRYSFSATASVSSS